MTDTPTDDQPGSLAEKAEHCVACYRLICPGQTYYLTMKYEVLCADCALDAPAMMPSSRGVIRVGDDLAVEVKRDWQGRPDAAWARAEAHHLILALTEVQQGRPGTRRRAGKNPHHWRTAVTAG
jgi:hypothetical protein